MGEQLYSVGLDVGTTSTQMVLSRLTVQNSASGFAVPEMEISQRQILYESPVHFTPLRAENRVDGDKLRSLLLSEYEKAGITPEQVDTGAVIITGETSRKENAATVLQMLSAFAGEFVVATAGPDMESVLAAKGSGATEYSEKTGKTVLHMDIGGGTSNLALIREGTVVQTGCLNVGGRLIKLDGTGVITYVSPVLKQISTLQVGHKPARSQLEQLAQQLCRALEMAAGRRPATALLSILSTGEVQTAWQIPEEPVTVSFSGGVADCITQVHPDLAFGDIGVYLGRAIANSMLCRGEFRLGSQTIRATVIGAGCHSTQLSGSTVFRQNVKLPKKNLPVVVLSEAEQTQPEVMAARLAQLDTREAVLAIPGCTGYTQVAAVAKSVCRAVGERPVYVCVQRDMAKALGQCISLQMPDRPCICLDRLCFDSGSYLDIGEPVGPCFPVVIKTLVLSNANTQSY